MTRRRLCRSALGALAALCGRRAAAAPGRAFLYVQPLGDELPSEDVALVRRALTALIGIETRLLPRLALPAAAYYPPRRRYRAEKLLDFLDRRLPSDGARILGLTGVDIATTKGAVFDWGVLGLGRIDGASSVISEFRCRMKSRGAAHARERLAKVAVHEAGHTLGLAHCPNRGCLMEDAEGHVATCDREYDFCGRPGGCSRRPGASSRRRHKSPGHARSFDTIEWAPGPSARQRVAPVLHWAGQPIRFASSTTSS